MPGCRLPAPILALSSLLVLFQTQALASAVAQPTTPPRLQLRGDDIHWRTRLRELAAQPPNFAGNHVLGVWGCGAECVMGAAIDRDTGRVIWLPGTICCWFRGPGDDDVEPVSFRRDDNLITLTGLRNENEGDDGLHLYRLEHDRFVHVADRARPPLPQQPTARPSRPSRTPSDP